MTPFKKDVITGLSASPKYLSSKYFYNEIGDKLFQKIMKLPEYYLTRAEYEIMKKPELTEELNITENLKIYELGAGDGTKTLELLKNLMEKKIPFTYHPIDISETVLIQLKENLSKHLPNDNIFPIVGEYFSVLKKLEGADQKMIMFLGSNIGNLLHPIAIDFLQKLHGVMNKEDILMVGFDMKKSPDVILKAYNDAEGVTAEFNLNLLSRINDELGGDFNLSSFFHYPVYNPESGTTKSYLISKKNQVVKIDHHEFHFHQWETIHTEISQKYSPDVIEWLAQQSNLKVVTWFSDQDDLFRDYFFRKG